MLEQCSTPRSRPAALGIGMLAVAGAAALPGLLAGQDRPTGSSETCIGAGCHEDIVDRRIVHGPVAQEKCGACHVETDVTQHRFAIIGDPTELCVTCHNIASRTHGHAPVSEGRCTACHDPHGSEHALMLVADPARDLCVSCHDQHADAEREFVHGPVANGACILCHEAHSSWHASLLTASPRDLCLSCHAELQPDPLRDRYVHAPAADDCLACHDAHASDVKHQLVAAPPELCIGCHAPVAEQLASASVVHGAMVREGGCTSCHSPHYSTFPALQSRPEISLCLDCHDEPLTAGDGRVLEDMARLLSDNPDHHGPVREGTCSACHRPHAADTANLLRQAYPPEFYAPYEEQRYALCFECHRPEMVKDEHGTGATRFRDGDRNLHWLHVNREKGRTCRACHEVHASKNPFHVRDAVPFGSDGWELEIRFERTDSGGRCAPGCHKEQDYDRGPGGAAGVPAGELP